MKRLILAALALTALAGCVAVPAPYPHEAYYYGPTVGVGVYSGPVFYHRHHRHHHHRHHRH